MDRLPATAEVAVKAADEEHVGDVGVEEDVARRKSENWTSSR
jgi:hypothetical protein